MLFKPDDDSGCRELLSPITPRHTFIEDYDTENVVELLASMWAFPATEYDAYKLVDGVRAEIVCCRPDVNCEVLDRPPRKKVRYMHGCDIAFYKDRPVMYHTAFVLEIFHKDSCFLCLDPISVSEFKVYERSESGRGVFLVQQFSSRRTPDWNGSAAWKAVGCAARPHISFSFP